MLRSQSPDLVRQELAAWAAATEMTRGVARAAALAASPAKKGRRAGMPVQAREISHGRTRRAVTAAIRTGRTSYTALTRELAKYRTVIDRNRHRPQGQMRQHLPPRRPRRHRHPDRSGRHHPRQHARLTSTDAVNQANTTSLPARGAGRHPARHAGPRHARNQKLPTVIKTGKLALTPKCLKPMALGLIFSTRARAQRVRLGLLQVAAVVQAEQPAAREYCPCRNRADSNMYWTPPAVAGPLLCARFVNFQEASVC